MIMQKAITRKMGLLGHVARMGDDSRQSWGLGVATPGFWDGGRGVSTIYYYIL